MSNNSTPLPVSLAHLGQSVEPSEATLALLENAQMFRGIEWAQIKALSTYMQIYRVETNAVLFREGEKGDFMCVVLQGKLEIHKADNNQVDKTVATALPGRSLGEMAMVDGEPRSATAIVMESTLLAVLTYDSFQKLMREKPALAVRILLKISQLLSQRLRLTSGILVDYLEK